MKLYIKQKVFSWRNRFYIKDDTDNNKYYAEGKMFTWGRQLSVYNENKQMVAFIKQQLFTLMPRYTIEIGSKETIIRRKFTFFIPKYSIDNSTWTMEGNFLAHEYQLIDVNKPIMNISKKWFTWGDSYELDIHDKNHELICLCIALVIDCIDASSNNN